MHRQKNRPMPSHVRTFTLLWSCTFAKSRGIDLHWPVIIFGQLSWYGMPANRPHYTADARKKGEWRCDQRCLRQRYSRLPSCNSVKTREHHSRFVIARCIRRCVRNLQCVDEDNFDGVAAVRVITWNSSRCSKRLNNEQLDPGCQNSKTDHDQKRSYSR